MYEVLALILLFTIEVGLHFFLSSVNPIFILVVPVFGTVAYSLWLKSYALAFVAGFLSGWSFYVMMLLWHLLIYTPRSVVKLRPKDFIAFLGQGMAFGFLGLLTVWARLSVGVLS
jgi:hypothetical protein